MSATADIERVPREDLEALQLERLRATVDRTLAAATPLSARLRDAGVGAGADVAALGDLRRLPFVTKEDLREHYPTGLFAVPRERIVRLPRRAAPAASRPSSATRRPTWTCGPRSSRAAWRAAACARGWSPQRQRLRPVHRRAGLPRRNRAPGRDDVPISTGRTRRQVMLIRDLGAQVITCTPSYALNIADAFEEAGVAPGDQPLRSACSAPSRGRSRCAARWSRAWGCAPATSTGCRRSSARACRPSARTRRAARTSTRTTSCPRSSTRRAASRWPATVPASSSSRRSPRRSCR